MKSVKQITALFAKERKRFLAFILCCAVAITALPFVVLNVYADSYISPWELNDGEISNIVNHYGFLELTQANELDTMNRATCAKILAYLKLGMTNAENLPDSTIYISDVRGTAYESYDKYIGYCINEGLMTCTEDRFLPGIQMDGYSYAQALLLSMGVKLTDTGSNLMIEVALNISSTELNAGLGKDINYYNLISKGMAARMLVNAGLYLRPDTKSSLFDEIGIGCENNLPQNRTFYLDHNRNGTYEKEEKVLSNYEQPNIVLFGKDVFTREGKIDETLQVIPTVTSGTLPECSYAWYTGELDESAIWDKENPPLMLSNTDTFMIPKDLTAGIYSYTVAVYAPGLDMKRKVFTVTVSSLYDETSFEVERPTDDSNEFDVNFKILGEDTTASAAYTPESGASSEYPIIIPSSVAITGIPGIDSTIVTVDPKTNIVSGVEMEISATSDESEETAYVNIPVNDAARILAGSDSASQLAASVIMTAGGTATVSETPPALSLIISAKDNTEGISATVDQSLTAGLAQRGGSLIVSTSNCSMTLDNNALSEKADNDLTISLKPSIVTDFDRIDFGTPIDTDLYMLDIKDENGNDVQFENAYASVNIMPTTSFSDRTVIVHIPDDGNIEMKAFGDTAASEALAEQYGIIVNKKNGWLSTTPNSDSSFDSGWRYYIDNQMVTDKTITNNHDLYYFNTQGIPLFHHTCNEATNGNIVLYDYERDGNNFTPPNFSITLTHLSPVGLVNLEWSGLADTTWYDADETSFTIATAAALAGLSKLVCSGNNFAGKTVTLGADIDLSGANWTPIGKQEQPFGGTFNGNDKTISNLSIINVSDDAPIYGGLFGAVSMGAVKNVTVGGQINIQQTAAIDNNIEVYVGGVAAIAFGSRIENCVSNVEISAAADHSLHNFFVGGIAGKIAFNLENSAVISGCTSAGSIFVSVNENSFVGGIAGAVTGGHIYNCCHTGKITGDSIDNNIAYNSFGTIAGKLIKMNASVETDIANCYNMSEISLISNTQNISKKIVGSSDDYTYVDNSYSYSALVRIGDFYTREDGNDSYLVIPLRIQEIKDHVSVLNAWVASHNSTLGIDDTPFYQWYTAENINGGMPCLTQHITPTPSALDFDFTAPQNLTFDGTQKTAIVTAKSGITGMGEITVKYYRNGIQTAPKEAGTYTVKIDIAASSSYTAATDLTNSGWTFTIEAKKTETTKPQEMHTPQTGDNRKVALWLTLLFLSGVGLLAIAMAKKRKMHAKNK